MKKVLMICYWFPPCSKVGALRSAAFARHLPGFGWEPWVVAPAERYILTGGMDAPLAELAGKCRILRTRTFEPILAARLRRRGRGDKPPVELQTREPARVRQEKLSLAWRLRDLVNLPDEHTGWIPFAVWAAWKHRREWDVLYTTFGPPSCFVAGTIVKYLTGKPWVADFRDPWTWKGKTMFPTTIHREISVWLERRGIGVADAVTSVSPSLTEMLAEAFPTQRDKFYTVYNGFEDDEIPQPVEARPVDRPLRIIYAGTLYRGRDPRALLAAVAHLKRTEPSVPRSVELEFLGNGTGPLAELAERLGIADCVTTSAPVPRTEALQRIAEADIGLLPVGEMIGSIAIPTKVYEYLACGKPILVLGGVASQPARFVCENRFGWCAPAGDVPAIVRLLREILTGRANLQGRLAFSPESVRRYNRKRQAGRMARVLDWITMPPGRRPCRAAGLDD